MKKQPQEFRMTDMIPGIGGVAYVVRNLTSHGQIQSDRYSYFIEGSLFLMAYNAIICTGLETVLERLESLT